MDISNKDILEESFFARNTLTVAKELLGKIIEVNGRKGRIVETEAYKRDKASHAYTKTERSSLMFDTYGHAYVYLIYGMYSCLNFTTEENKAGAVLIRAVEPLDGIEEMITARKTGKNTDKNDNTYKYANKKKYDLKNLCSGPGKLCQAFAIDKQFNGLKLGKEIKVYTDNYKVKKISRSGRIGITEDAHLPWRFFISGNSFVSR